MKFIFDMIADPIRARMTADKRIQHALSYMNYSKIVTVTDFSECFIDESRYAAGRLGRLYFCHETDMLNEMAAQHQSFRLPIRFANTQTRDNVALQSNLNRQELRCYYLGDLMQMTDRFLTLKNEIPRAISFGEGEMAFNTFHEMRMLPDYGHHFPNPRPPSGGRRIDEEPSPSFTQAGMQPAF